MTNPKEKIKKIKPKCLDCSSCIITVDYETSKCDKCRGK